MDLRSLIIPLYSFDVNICFISLFSGYVSLCPIFTGIPHERAKLKKHLYALQNVTEIPYLRQHLLSRY